MYSKQEHTHRFLCWAAGRASSVKGYRFPVSDAKHFLESTKINDLLHNPERLPVPNEMDAAHRQWRATIITTAQTTRGFVLTHGIAAKLINVYLKGAFCINEFADHERVREIHPPIDRLLLAELSDENAFGELGTISRQANAIGWSRLDSDKYEKVIQSIRDYLQGEPLWSIEKYWPGHQ